ncbi:hypothetical protein J3E72DRAFT_421779 [Bipolaris maydis]|nr:hypothetical protein J3E73DRAFT_424107 [Bipolaris maydis]KAJ5051407.1 hypothetical protein J3E74DRAFT_422924 [Bipolaris maydis]KAJ6196452.1 hypothetical protein J3E72DRAFT_421779 [Bipolaris maydis]KAJ6270540.1 hypothetical protein PSV08DRAFT_402613 [Bipolaris maydis]KAJ6279018.1 hypothetical protein J3E71DRAFT_355017 [Bipolaris maydis]
MEKINWKDKYSESQLKKKRWLDRRNRKKARQQSKLTAAELEEQLQLVLTGEQGALINRLKEENMRLRTKLTQYQTKLENIVLAGKEMLDSDETFNNDGDWSFVSGGKLTTSTVQQLQQQWSSEEEDIRMMKAIGSLSGDRITMDSILFEVFSFCQKPANPKENNLSCLISTQQLLEYMMTWKLFGDSAVSGFEILIERFSLAKAPHSLTRGADSSPFLVRTLTLATEKVLGLVESGHFYESILEHLLYGREIFNESTDTNPNVEYHSSHLSELERQQRAVAACAYESMRFCRDLFRTSAEYATMFWAQYRFYKFLVFPTLENLMKCPPWHRPRLAQLTQNHPSFIDLLAWPALREELIKSWDKYDLHQLLVELIRNFEMRNVESERSPFIRIASDASDLELDKEFEVAMYNLENYCTLAPFSRQYPELAHLVSGFQFASNVVDLNTNSDDNRSGGKANRSATLSRMVDFDHAVTSSCLPLSTSMNALVPGSLQRKHIGTHLAADEFRLISSMHSQHASSKAPLRKSMGLGDTNKSCQTDSQLEQSADSHTHAVLPWEFFGAAIAPKLSGETFIDIMATAQDDRMDINSFSLDAMPPFPCFHDENL